MDDLVHTNISQVNTNSFGLYASDPISQTLLSPPLGMSDKQKELSLMHHQPESIIATIGQVLSKIPFQDACNIDEDNKNSNNNKQKHTFLCQKDNMFQLPNVLYDIANNGQITRQIIQELQQHYSYMCSYHKNMITMNNTINEQKNTINLLLKKSQEQDVKIEKLENNLKIKDQQIDSILSILKDISTQMTSNDKIVSNSDFTPAKAEINKNNSFSKIHFSPITMEDSDDGKNDTEKSKNKP